jgi:23S rRNA (uracil1939-C5)-methyltransferase
VTTVEIAITALAAGGDAIGRDEGGRVTFIARVVPGDRVRVRIVEEHARWARGELVDVVAPSPDRVVPPCALFAEDACGGCQWQHVARPAQLAAKQAIVAGALRKAIARGMALREIVDPGPAYGWRRRARLHAQGGALGFYAPRSHAVADLAIACAQLDPALDRAVAAVRDARPPDGEVDVAIGHRGEVVVATAAWDVAGTLVGRAGIVGVVADGVEHGTVEIEIEPGLVARAGDFAQAAARANRALIELVLDAVGSPAKSPQPQPQPQPQPARLLELYAGEGNFTRALVAAGWDVTAADVVAPRRVLPGVRRITGTATDAIARVAGERFDAIVLDPPRAGAIEAVRAIAAPRIAYVSCDPATLGRDLEILAERGYRAVRAQPIDVMPQTAHVEVVVALTAPDSPARTG